MSSSVYSEINFHITWHTKSSLPMISAKIEERLYHYLTHRILETKGSILHAIGGIETHVHIGVSLPPKILVSDWVGKLKGSSSYYINHEVQPKALEWQRGYGIVTFGSPNAAVTTMASRIAGKDSMTSAIRMITESTQPPMKPEIAPSTHPILTPTMITRSASGIDCRVP
jgi:REP element-mobilizing transposase RayT